MKRADLSEALSGLQIQEPPLYPEPEGPCGVRVIPRGSGIPHIAAAEIKSMGKLKTPETMLPQLWFGRTKNLIRGVHERGVFHTIHVSSVEDDLQSWETGKQNQRALRKVAALLSQLRDLVMKSEERACVVVCQKQTKPVLRVFATTQRKTALPQDLRDKFWNKK